MQKSDGSINRPVNRRSFLKTGMLAGSAATVGAGLAGSLKPAFGQSNSLTKGDVAILRMLAAAELIEADLWTQYAELGGIGDNPPIEVAPNEPLNSYQAALSNPGSDGPQYITRTPWRGQPRHLPQQIPGIQGERPVNFDESAPCKAAPQPERTTSAASPASSTSTSTLAGSSVIAATPTRTLAPRTRKPLTFKTAPPSPSPMRISMAPPPTFR